MLIYKVESVEYLDDREQFLFYYEKCSPFRKNKIDRLVSLKDKKLSLGVDVLLKKLLIENGIYSQNEIPPVKMSERGKPLFDKTENLFFSLSHSENMVMCAISDSLIGCDIYCAVMLEILNETKKEELLQKALPKIGEFVRHHPNYNDALSKYDRITHKNFTELPVDKIKSSGYVVDTLEASLWCFLTTENYKDCVLKAVNLGSDTDTVACVAGSIAGLYYGDIPAEWIDCIRNKKTVDKIIEKFSNTICELFEEKRFARIQSQVSQI